MNDCYINPKLLAKGRFLPQNLNITTAPTNLVVEPETQQQIEELWIEKEKIARENKLNFYNGMSYRLNSLKVNNNSLDIELSTIYFKTRQMLRYIPEVFTMSEEHYRKGCFSGTSFKTKDGYYLMVELSGKSLNTNSADLIGGIMETNIEMTNGGSIFEQLYSELNEEVFIEKDEIDECVLRAVYLDQGLNVGFYFETTTTLTSQEISNRFNTSKKDIDIKDIIILSEDEYKTILANHNANKKLILSVFTDK